MGKKLDLTGQKFNHLTVIKEGEPKKYYNKKTDKYETKVAWWCKCDCGNEDLILVVGAHLKTEKENRVDVCAQKHQKIMVKNVKNIIHMI